MIKKTYFPPSIYIQLVEPLLSTCTPTSSPVGGTTDEFDQSQNRSSSDWNDYEK